jgi:branched-chain amino acid transport system substrate-binding protein
MKEYRAFMQKYNPNADVNEKINVKAYFSGQLLVSILKQAGDNLTRENIMNIAKNMHFTSEDPAFLLLPGVDVHTTPDNYEMFPKMRLMQFDGKYWVPL